MASGALDLNDAPNRAVRFLTQTAHLLKYR